MKPVRWSRLVPVLLMVPAVLAYSNSLSGVFLYDDFLRIVNNSDLRGLWSSILLSSRPLTQLTFHLNVLICGLNRACFHAINLSIHLACGLLLYGCVRRTLVQVGLQVGQRATLMAAGVAVLWLLHPIQTESVTYIVQRSESLMGFFYLLTLYAVLVSVRSRAAHRWETLAVCACALGMATKPVMVTAPLVVLLFDRCFLSGTFSEALRRRRAFYVALFATWVVLAALLSVPHESASSVGFGSGGPSSWVYLITQMEVLVHYVRLLLWPHPLCFDYGWAQVAHWTEATLPGIAVVGLIGFTARGLIRRPAVWFPAAFFLITLAPTSSVIPIADFAVEHRLYLPSAAAAVLSVLGCESLLEALGGRWTALRRFGGLICVGMVVLIAAALGCATYFRNETYRSVEWMYRDVLRTRPGNFRAHVALMSHLIDERRYDGAEQVGRELLEKIVGALNVGGVEHVGSATSARYFYALARNGLGRTLLLQGRTHEAEAQLREALRVRPGYSVAEHNLAVCLYTDGRLEEAEAAVRRVLRRDSWFPNARELLEVIRAKKSSPGGFPGLPDQSVFDQP